MTKDEILAKGRKWAKSCMHYTEDDFINLDDCAFGYLAGYRFALRKHKQTNKTK